MEQDPKPKKKHKRPDVAARRLANSKTNETCVKCCLRSTINGDADDKDAMVKELDARATAYSKRIHLASLKACGMLKDLFASVSDADLTSYTVPVDLFDASVVRQLMLGLQGVQTPHPVVKRYLEARPELSPSFPRHLGDSNTYTFGAVQFITTMKNSLWMRLTGRIKAFLKRSLPKEPGLRTGMLFRIHGWPTPPSVADKYEETQKEVAIIDIHRRLLGLTRPEDKIDKLWLKSEANLWSILRYYVFLNRHYARHGLPEFNITPIFSIKRHFMYVDNNTFYGVLKALKVVGCDNKAFSAMADHHWRSVFHVGRLEGKNNTFTGTIQTDGVTMVAHFRRPKNAQDEMDGVVAKANKGIKELLKPGDRVVAFDPGRANILYGVERVSEEDGRSRVVKYALTRGQYYTEAGVLVARKNTETWSSNIASELRACSKVSTKGVSLVKHERYLRWHMEHSDGLWTEYMKPRWARQRFRLYGGKKRVFANFFNRIADRDRSMRVVVAYGSATFAPGGKNEVSVPTSRAFKECRYRFPTATVDEFRTTKIFEEDDAILDAVQRGKDAMKGRSAVLRGLLWSSTANKFVNRDRNAALNILRCATLARRPFALTRSPGGTPLRQSIKWIK